MITEVTFLVRQETTNQEIQEACEVLEKFFGLPHGSIDVTVTETPVPTFLEYFKAYVERSEWPAGKSFAVFAKEIWEWHMANIKVIQAHVGETVEIQWMDGGKRTVSRHTAPPKSVREARDSPEFRTTADQADPPKP